jgi:hypothetical protein
LILREVHRLQVFENSVLRRIFGPKKDEVMGGWRKLHNEELHSVNSSPITRRMIWTGHVAQMEEKRNAYTIMMRKPEGRPGLRWVDDIKMDLRYDVVVWTVFIWLKIGTSRGILWIR